MTHDKSLPMASH